MSLVLVQPLPPHNANRSSATQISIDNAEESTQTLLDTPGEKEKFPQIPLPHSGLNLKSALKITLILILATSYLTFCVIAYHRTVTIPIGSKGVVGLPFFQFNTASGITTVAILIIYVALWPIKGLVDEIRSEEFFRLLRTYPKGVPLGSVNAISVPTTGVLDIALATFRHHCSRLLTSTLITTLLIAVTSVLAPAALTAASVSIDVVDPAFQIGAIPNSSYFEVVSGGYIGINTSISSLFQFASIVSWTENVLNVSTAYSSVNSSKDDSLGYIVPFPPDYTPAMQAQWTTDIIVFDPSCNWRAPNTTVIFGWAEGQNVTLLETNLTIFMTNDYFSLVAKASVGLSSLPQSTDFTTLDGSTVFVVSQQTNISVDQQQVLDLSMVPTLQVSNGNIFAFLVCSPHVSIQTRQVWANGEGVLTLGQHQPSQGNLDLSQVNLLLSFILSDFATSSGPLTTGLGPDMMIRLIFGANSYLFNRSAPAPPAPLTNTTNAYKQVIQSAAKVFVSGKMGVANVTGSRSKEQVAFKSSLGHVIASAILFALLTTGFVVAQFRKGRDAFTLVDVAAALADSNAPQKFVEMKQQVDVGERRRLIFDQSGKGDWIVRLGASTED